MVSSIWFVKHSDTYLLMAALGRAFVFGIVIAKLEMLFTPVIRDARALELGRGGRTSAAKSSAMSASSASIPHCGFLFFMYVESTMLCSHAQL